MTDKELLEMAARAAGIGKLTFSELGRVSYRKDDYPGGTFWNPLISDGDALRLAVKLGLTIGHYLNTRECVVTPTYSDEPIGNCFYDNDPYAATRRAIVRAAAEIGKTL